MKTRIEILKQTLLSLKAECESMLQKIDENDRSYWRRLKGTGIYKRIKEAEIMIELAKTVKKILESGVL